MYTSICTYCAGRKYWTESKYEMWTRPRFGWGQLWPYSQTYIPKSRTSYKEAQVYFSSLISYGTVMNIPAHRLSEITANTSYDTETPPGSHCPYIFRTYPPWPRIQICTKVTLLWYRTYIRSIVTNLIEYNLVGLIDARYLAQKQWGTPLHIGEWDGQPLRLLLIRNLQAAAHTVLQKFAHSTIVKATL